MRLIKPLAAVMLTAFILVIGYIYIQNNRVYTDYLSVYNYTAEADSYSFKSKEVLASENKDILEYKNFSGVYTWAKLEYNSDISISYDNQSSKGFIAIVLLDKNHNEIEIVEEPFDGVVNLKNDTDVVFIRLVGNKATGVISIDIEGDEETKKVIYE